MSTFQEQIDQALSSLSALFSSILSELTKRDEDISSQTTEITNLRVSVADLESLLDSETMRYREAIQGYQEVIESQSATISDLQIEIGNLQREIELLKNPKPVDPPPPIEVSPDITTTLGSPTSPSGLIGSFRPPLKGERQGKETRYRGVINPEITILCDVHDNGQVRVIIERCNATLPITAPVIETSLIAQLGNGTGYVQPSFRLHHHTRPAITINPSPAPSFDLQSLISSGLIPNYNPTAKPTETDLTKIDLAQHPWMKWNGKSNPYDPITEEFGQIVNSWIGGAGHLLNEPATLMPVQVAYLLTSDPRAWYATRQLADSSGNYPIHYKIYDTWLDHFARAAETSTLPFLQSAQSVSIKTAAGNLCPIPDVAHQHSLAYLAALLTGDRYYREECEAWCTYNLLTRPKDELRENGIIWSGQVRAAAWALRALLHAYIVTTITINYDYYKQQIITNLQWMSDRFTLPFTSPNYRSIGVVSTVDFRLSPMLQYVSNTPPLPPYFSTFMHHQLCHVLDECVRAGFDEAIPIRDHLLKVAEGVWLHSPTPWDVAWGGHVYPSTDTDWPTIMKATFAGRGTDPSTFQAPPITPDYLAWYRSAVVAGVNAGEGWAVDALRWIDTQAPKFKGGVPLAWQINPTR